jgi:hypothetical protein
MAPSALYSKLLSLSQAHAKPRDLSHILAIRAPDARHGWGHSYLVSRNLKLQDYMDNAAFESHLRTTGPYLESLRTDVHEIIVDEHQRKAVIHLSYFLTPKGSEETVEQNMIWTLKFTDEEVNGGVDGVLIKESIEFIDAAASSRLGTVIRALHGELNDDVRGGITLKEG